MAQPAVVTFEQVARPLALFVRGLYGHEVPVRKAPPGTARAFGSDLGLFFPDSFPMVTGDAGRALYFAAAAHLVAHARFGTGRAVRGSLRPIQVVLVSLLEDARVERRCLDALPGLRARWRAWHRAQPSDHPTFPALCARIARALFDPDHPDPHPLVDKARDWFFVRQAAQPSPEACREFGSRLGNDFGQLRLPFNFREYRVEPAYRDDHRWLWDEPAQEDQPTAFEATELLEAVAPRKDAHAGGSRGSEGGGLASARPVQMSAGSDGEQPAETRCARYPEWDYVIGLSRPSFCMVREQEAAGAPNTLGHTPLCASLLPRITRLARALRVQSLVRRRREPEGELLDLDAAVEAHIDLRSGRTPDARVYRCTRRVPQRIAVLLLLDLSQSTGARLPGAPSSVLELIRDACLLFGHLLAQAQSPFALHGFSSDGRHAVDYFRFKNFADPWDQASEARIQALVPLRSTRMGAALRHACACLRGVREDKRLILLLTDGEPSDVDAPDPRYLLEDTKRAVREARREGNSVFALSVDPAADRYVRPIFGDGRYLVLDRIERLPEVLPRLYARIAS